MATKKVYENMVSQALAAVWADVRNLKLRRGTTFKLDDAKPYVDAVNGMVPAEEQSKEVFDLHIKSVNAHFEILKGLTDTVRPEDDPFVEHYQTGPILEVLREEDPAFDKSVRRFVDAIAENEALIGREAVRIYGGFYGPIAVVDFAFSPGSTPNIVNRILRPLDIPKAHKETILASKSFGMTTSYALGGTFQAALEASKTVADAVREEVKMFQFIYDQPIAAQNQIMGTHNLGGHGPHTSFDTDKYQKQYKERMRPVVKAALAAGVHPANIVCVPAYCVGDVAHHNSQTNFNFAQDPIVMAMWEAHTQTLENTLRRGLEKGYKSEYAVLSTAIGTSAACFAYELVKDYVPIVSVIELLVNRFHNMVLMNPSRPLAAELHNTDFMMSLWRGWKVIQPKPLGSGGEIDGVAIDFSPIDTHDVLRNIHRYTYPPCAITQRLGTMLKFSDFPCLLTSEPVTATMLTHVIALHKETAMAPLRFDKDWGISQFRMTNVPWVTGLGTTKVGYEQYTEAL